MIEETPRIKNSGFEDIIDDNLLQDSTSLIEESTEKLSRSDTQVNEVKSSRLFIEILVCSLLLWSMLFIKQSKYEEHVTQTIKQVLDTKMQNGPIQEFVEKLETAVQQIL